MLSFKKWLYITALLVAAISILLTGCGKEGSITFLKKPTVIITSYEGVEDTDEIIDPYYYQNKIYWRGISEGGVVTGYAYRVLDLDGKPVDLPRTYTDEEGWIYHYKPGADQAIPMDETDSKSIWTTKVFDTIHFPATVNGDSTSVTSVFEIKCKDHREQESDVVKKYFNVVSHVPDVDIIFSDRFRPLAAAVDPDNPHYATTGLGFEVEFEIAENTPYISPPNPANYFKFYVEERDIATGDLISRMPEEGGWYETKGQKNVRRAWLAMREDDKKDFPGRDDVFTVLAPNKFESDNYKTPETETRLIFKAVNMAGVHSVERTAKFSVFDKFRPKVLIYGNITYVLGGNHFTFYKDEEVTRPIPEVDTPEGTQFGLPFFVNKDGVFSALWSDDLKVYLRWGWKGQYDEDNPNKSLINEVHDYRDGVEIDYLGTIKAFDLRLGGKPFHYPPLQSDPEYQTKYLYRDSEGREWLRVPRHHEIDTRVLLNTLEPGNHTFEVRVLDSQNRTSEIEEFSFNIQRPVPREEKQGILIVDNDSYPVTGPTALDAATNEFYEEIFAGFSGKVETIDRLTIRNNHWDSKLHSDQVENVISTTDLEPYRLVIWHSDHLTLAGGPDNSNFHLDLEAINLYLQGNNGTGGGNMILSAGQNLKYMHEFYISGTFALPLTRHPNVALQRYFGLPYFERDTIDRLSVAFTANTFFLGAKPVGNGYPEINLNLDFHPVVKARGALGAVAFFDEEKLNNTVTSVVYRMKTTEQGEEEYADKAVAIRTKTARNTTWIFGFPLSYMEKDDVKNLMDEIIRELW
ncbi:MAG: hypothetical protein WCX83_00480 [Candidatus Cloacimonas sp.]|nr:hypothetical protein [Candidatus Cloacimonadota bacterium]